ncbi:MAG TPA: MerR family transcriptional regulator [Phycisphaerae bacterium]|nr:MerR family transcriptional regulator [Phycisphaerae bacterium]
MQSYNTKQVSEVTGASTSQLNHWDAKGLVKPSIRPATGRGSRRLYSYADLVAIQLVKRLRDQEVSLQRIRRCVQYLRRHLPDIVEPLGYCTLLTDGHEIYLIEDEKTLRATVKRQGQKAWLELSIAGIDQELRARIVQLGEKKVDTVSVGDYAYQVEIEPDEDGGYVAEVAGLPGCITQGDSYRETLENVQDAIETYLSAVEDLKSRGVNLPVRRAKRRRRVTA